MRLAATYIGIFFLLLSGCTPDPRSKFDGRAELDKLGGPQVGSMETSLKLQAEQTVNAGDYKRAAQIYKQLYDKSPDNKDYAIAMAENFRRAGDNDSSLRVTDIVLKKDPANAAALENKGLCLMNTGDFVDAGKVFEQVMKIDDKRWRTLDAIGILFAMKNMTGDAVAYYNAALAQSTGNASVLNNLGLTLAMDRQYDQAIDAFERARHHLGNASPEIKNIDLNMALVYAISGNLDQAEQTAAPHLSKAALYNNMGFYATLSKNKDMAKSYLNMALTQSPVYYERAWKNLAAVTGENSDQSNENAEDASPQQSLDAKKPKPHKHNKDAAPAEDSVSAADAPKVKSLVLVPDAAQEAAKPVADTASKDEVKPKEQDKPADTAAKDTTKSLGTLSEPPKDQGQPLADIPARETPQPVPPSPVMTIPLEQVPATAPAKDQGQPLADIPLQTVPAAAPPVLGTTLNQTTDADKAKSDR